MIWLNFTLNGHDYYAVTLDKLSIAEAREVKKFTGVTLHSLVMASAGQVDGDVLAAVVYLAKRRAGEEIDWSEIDRIDVVELAENMSVTTGEEPQADPVTNGKTDAAPDVVKEPTTT